MDSIIEQIDQTFAAFEKEQNPALLYRILDSMEAAESQIAMGDVAARNLAVARRLHFFLLLDSYMDPLWNPNDVPARGVPPPLSHGVIFSSGEVDPESIPDPEMREQYVQALKASKDAFRWYGIQAQLRRIDERAMLFFKQLLYDRYQNLQDDREFEELLVTSKISAVRRQRLRALRAKPR